jgi:steroid 5-alpha reductase family enzyme
MVAAMVGLRRQGSEHAWMAPDLIGWDGVGATEESHRHSLAEWWALTSRGENHREYQRTTNRFFPWLSEGSQ